MVYKQRPTPAHLSKVAFFFNCAILSSSKTHINTVLPAPGIPKHKRTELLGSVSHFWTIWSSKNHWPVSFVRLVRTSRWRLGGSREDSQFRNLSRFSP